MTVKIIHTIASQTKSLFSFAIALCLLCFVTVLHSPLHSACCVLLLYFIRHCTLPVVLCYCTSFAIVLCLLCFVSVLHSPLHSACCVLLLYFTVVVACCLYSETARLTFEFYLLCIGGGPYQLCMYGNRAKCTVLLWYDLHSVTLTVF